MKRTVMAAMVLSLFTGSIALADPPQDHRHDRDQRQEQWHDEHHDRDQRDRLYEEHHDRRDERRGEMRGHIHFGSGRYQRPRGYYAHHWRRGDRLPRAWRGAAYVVPDWGYYRLRPPPAGYYWVRVNDNAVLAAVATGVIVDVAVDIFH